MATIDGKQIVNMLYHAGVETVLTIGYAKIARKLLKRPPPKVDFNVSDVGMLSVDILLAMASSLCWLNRVLSLLILFVFENNKKKWQVQ